MSVVLERTALLTGVGCLALNPDCSLVATRMLCAAWILHSFHDSACPSLRRVSWKLHLNWSSRSVPPSDRWDSIRKKITEYFDADVDRVWLVEPSQHKALVFRAPTQLTELGEGDILRGEGVLDGFEPPLSELFGEEFTEETDC